jgi:hypothetical protein
MRCYNADLPGGTATTTIQIQARQTLKLFVCSWANAAAGKIELSKSSASQIGTAQPTGDVICRLSAGGGANQSAVAVPISEAVVPFQNLYVHQTGAANLGTAMLY